MTLRFDTPDGPLDLAAARCIVAGWTGRDARAVAHHIAELEALGVPAPSRTPLPYIVSPALLTQDDTIHCVGPHTSGEAEPAVLLTPRGRFLTLASDHTDRALEAHSVALSKQVCAKPVARTAWPIDAVSDLDALVLRSWVEEAGGWRLYQDGTLAALRPIDEILAAVAAQGGGDTVVLCGTLSAIGGVRPAARMRMELADLAAGRTIALAYETRTLPANA